MITRKLLINTRLGLALKRSSHHGRPTELSGAQVAGDGKHAQEATSAADVEPPTELFQRANPKARDRLAERDLLLSVLSASTTKREAKSYLSRFKPPPQGQGKTDINIVTTELHISLIKLRAPQKLDDETLLGLAHTFATLTRLGLSCVIVLDCELDFSHQTRDDLRESLAQQSERLIGLLTNACNIKASRLDYILGVSSHESGPHSTVEVRGSIEVEHHDVLENLLNGGTVPIIPSIGYTMDTQHVVALDADEVVLALTREFAGIRRSVIKTQSEDRDDLTGSGVIKPSQQYILDRIIVLDPLGGLPSRRRRDKSHIFINMEQEYQDIRDELLLYQESPKVVQQDQTVKEGEEQTSLSFDASNPTSRLARQEVEPRRANTSLPLDEDSSYNSDGLKRNIKNLDLIQKSLALLPTSTSALIATPLEASTRSESQSKSIDLDVRTRRPRNPLIYNMLTDRPQISSSLPISRLRPVEGSKILPSSATFIKRGMPLTIIPDPRIEPWQPPRLAAATTTAHPAISAIVSHDRLPLAMDDPRIDFPRLLNLIEDSFNRPLDTQHYLQRIQNKIAGLIVAGNYEGGAILTWETPPGVSDDGSEASRARMVPYLDKFAVLKRNQGAGGVADIVFTAMVRSCFPEGVCWRSRKNNPVNKWYFERSVGTWKIPDTQWTMFWTTPGVGAGEDAGQDRQRFSDYAAVCRTVLPSWADNKHVVD